MKFTDYLKGLLIRNDINFAIKEIIQAINAFQSLNNEFKDEISEIQKNIYILSSNFHNGSRRRINGKNEQSKLDVEFNMINLALLNIIDNFASSENFNNFLKTYDSFKKSSKKNVFTSKTEVNQRLEYFKINNSIVPKIKNYSEYLDYFRNIPLKKLIQGYNKYELEILEDLKMTVRKFLILNGFKEYNILFINEDKLSISVSYTQELRNFIIHLDCMTKSNANILKESKINNFGYIQNIIIKSNIISEDTISDLLHLLKNQTNYAYTALEQGFLINSEELSREVFNGLYDYLEGQLKLNNKERFYGRIWFIIAEKNLCYYYFDKSLLKKVIEHYKKNQVAGFSPFELTIWIMTAPLPFQDTLAIKSHEQKKPLTLPFKDVLYQGVADKIFLAEYFLYQSDDYIGYTLFEKSGYFLIVGIPSKIGDEILPEIEEIKNILEIKFAESIKKWSPYIKSINSFFDTSKVLSISEFISTTIAKTISEIIKPF